jgi:tetratricopeptide (TPR) repeat protein
MNLAQALAERGAVAEQEKIAREGLLPPADVTPERAPMQVGSLITLADALCQQKRFAEAQALVLEQKQELAARDPRNLLTLDKLTGTILARSGNAKEALPILISVANNSLSSAQDCADAAFVAIGAGDLESYRHLCAIALTRFAAGAEGVNALAIVSMLLAAPENEVMIEAAGEIVDRVERSGDFLKDLDTGIREWLHFRKGDLTAAGGLWSRASGSAAPTLPISWRARTSEYVKALIGFRSALPLARLGRSDEALQAYAVAVKNLGSAASAEKPRDLGESWARWYLAEAHRRETEQFFNSKGIALPGGAALPISSRD